MTIPYANGIENPIRKITPGKTRERVNVLNRLDEASPAGLSIAQIASDLHRDPRRIRRLLEEMIRDGDPIRREGLRPIRWFSSEVE